MPRKCIMCILLPAFPKGTHYHFTWVNTLGKLHKHFGNSWTLAVSYHYVLSTHNVGHLSEWKHIEIR